MQKSFSFDNSYARLPASFYRPCAPASFPAPRLIAFNAALAAELGLHAEGLDEAHLAAIFSGNSMPMGAEPVALAYAGHQFGHFVPQLGDGRALLLGEVVDRYGVRRDIQLKGCGQTPFSRRGDGRAALGPVMREYIVSEAMHALGVKTTRALACVATGEAVERETLLPGAVLTRVAASHIRIGTFEYFAARGDLEALRILADYTVKRHYPEAAESANLPLALLEAACDAQASLVARWMQVGFIHGVMNTDNMALSGETIDYGPCAFLDSYDPQKTFSAIDRHGRYAFGNQPLIAQWNLARLAENLLPLIGPDPQRAARIAEPVLHHFSDRFERYWLSGMRQKLGLSTQEYADKPLIDELLTLMHANHVDYTLAFRLLSASVNADACNGLFNGAQSFADWKARWQQRLSREPQSPGARMLLMQSVNPAYIPRNHRIAHAIEAAVSHNDFSDMENLLRVLANPYRHQQDFAHYAQPPDSDQIVSETFCGT